MDEVIPSSWDGNYTCDDDNIMRRFVMNFTKSASTIKVIGDILIDGSVMSVSGTFGSAYKYLVIQSQNVILHDIFGRNFTNVEINAQFETELLIKGVIILLDDSQGRLQCDVELRRNAGKFLFEITCISQQGGIEAEELPDFCIIIHRHV